MCSTAACTNPNKMHNLSRAGYNAVISCPRRLVIFFLPVLSGRNHTCSCTYALHHAHCCPLTPSRSFCWSAVHAASLVLKNILRFAAVNVVGGFLMWLGKLAVMAACGLVAFGLSELDYYSDPDEYPDTVLSSPVLPILISAIVAYVVAQLFFQVGVVCGVRCRGPQRYLTKAHCHALMYTVSESCGAFAAGGMKTQGQGVWGCPEVRFEMQLSCCRAATTSLGGTEAGFLCRDVSSSAPVKGPMRCAGWRRLLLAMVLHEQQQRGTPQHMLAHLQEILAAHQQHATGPAA